MRKEVETGQSAGVVARKRVCVLEEELIMNGILGSMNRKLMEINGV